MLFHTQTRFSLSQYGISLLQLTVKDLLVIIDHPLEWIIHDPLHVECLAEIVHCLY